MPENLRIELVQTYLHWEDVSANLNHLTHKINSIANETDIIVLPEMFTTGFTMKPDILAEEHEGRGLQWMQKIASGKKCAVVGSLSIKENNNYYNRLYWVFPDESYKSYDKRHLFRMGNEHQHYSSGKEKFIIEYKGWKICPLVCYDLRFPVWSRNTKNNPYDVLIYVANWPAVRSYPWKQLLIARAIENQSYVIGVNRVGEDGNKIPHSGDSMVIGPKGEILTEDYANQDTVIEANIALNPLKEFRNQFPAMMDADSFNVVE
jgi:omega-amidase